MDIGTGLPGHASGTDGTVLIAAAVADFDRIGCDGLIFMGNDPDPRQVDLLADVIGLKARSA